MAVGEVLVRVMYRHLNILQSFVGEQFWMKMVEEWGDFNAEFMGNNN